MKRERIFSTLALLALFAGIYLASTGQRVLDSNGTSGGDGVQTQNTSTGSVSGLPPVTTTTSAVRCWMADQITLRATSTKSAVESTLVMQFSDNGTTWSAATGDLTATTADGTYGISTINNFAVAADSMSTVGKVGAFTPLAWNGSNTIPGKYVPWRYCRFVMVTNAGAPNGTIAMRVTIHYPSAESFQSAQSN